MVADGITVQPHLVPPNDERYAVSRDMDRSREPSSRRDESLGCIGSRPRPPPMESDRVARQFHSSCVSEEAQFGGTLADSEECGSLRVKTLRWEEFFHGAATVRHDQNKTNDESTTTWIAGGPARARRLAPFEHASNSQSGWLPY